MNSLEVSAAAPNFGSRASFSQALETGAGILARDGGRLEARLEPVAPQAEFPFELRTERVTLRDFVEADRPAFVDWAGHDRMYQYMAWRLNGPDEADAEFSRLVTHPARLATPRQRWYLAALNEVGSFIGITGFDRLPEATGEFGWYLSPPWWNQGYASHITDRLLIFAFEELDLLSVTATCDPDNLASRRVLEKNGLTLLSEETKSTWQGERPRLRLGVSRRDWTS